MFFISLWRNKWMAPFDSTYVLHTMVNNGSQIQIRKKNQQRHQTLEYRRKDNGDSMLLLKMKNDERNVRQHRLAFSTFYIWRWCCTLSSIFSIFLNYYRRFIVLLLILEGLVYCVWLSIVYHAMQLSKREKNTTLWKMNVLELKLLNISS